MSRGLRDPSSRQELKRCSDFSLINRRGLPFLRNSLERQKSRLASADSLCREDPDCPPPHGSRDTGRVSIGGKDLCNRTRRSSTCRQRVPLSLRSPRPGPLQPPCGLGRSNFQPGPFWPAHWLRLVRRASPYCVSPIKLGRDFRLYSPRVARQHLYLPEAD